MALQYAFGKGRFERGGTPTPQAPKLPALPTFPQTPAPAPVKAAAPAPVLTNTTKSSPDVTAMQGQYQQQLGNIQNKANSTDPNQQFLLDKFKERLGTDNTQSLMDRAAGATRDVQAAQRPMLDRAAAMSGAGPGAGAVQQRHAAIRASAKANADIQEQRSRDVDAMVLGGQGIVNAPGQRALSYDQMATGLTQANPALAIEANKLQQAQLGLSQYTAQQNAAAQQQQMQLQAQAQQQQQQQAQLNQYLQMLSMFSKGSY